MTPRAMNESGAARAIRRIDRYDLLEEVGSGGMAVVYRGRDTALDREVAVKLLHPHLAARAEARARFSREARAVARLAHPGIVEIYDFAGDAAVESYLITEFVRGRTLRAFAEQSGVGFPEVAALVVRALADALAHAHAAGVIHRDLKPENVLVREDGGRRALKLVDFGIARILASDERMTMTGALVGSPNHMAPEIIEGRDADARSDIFSLGTILYWLATGQMPFAGANPTATLRRVIEGDSQDPRTVSPLVSDELAGVIGRALALDPEERYPSAAALRDALDGLLQEAGLDDPPAELAAFLADPEAYRAAFPARLAAALTSRAREALRRAQTARALRLWNRVLAVDPGNAVVLGELAAMERRARLRRLARRATVALAVAAALAGVATWIRTRPPPPTPAPAAEALAPPEPRPAAPPVPEPSPAAEPPRPGPARGAEAGAARPAAAPPRPAALRTTVSVHVRPYAQRALLDGVEVARGAQRVVVELVQGQPHLLQIEHACCNPFVRQFAADEALPPNLELKASLEPRPALLRVEADAPARVFVGGRQVGTAGASLRSPIPVPVPSGGDNPYEGEAEIRIESEGRPPYATTANIRAGAELTVVAPRSEESP